MGKDPCVIHVQLVADALLCFVKVLENKAAVKTYSPDFFHFSINGLEQLIETYGLASAQYIDAVALLNTVSQRVSSTVGLFNVETNDVE